MAIATLDDRSARIEVVVYAEALPAVTEFPAKGRIVVAEGVCGIDDFNGGYRITAERMSDIVAARLGDGCPILYDSRSQRGGDGSGARRLHGRRRIIDPLDRLQDPVGRFRP